MIAAVHRGLAGLPAGWDRLARARSFVVGRRFLASVDAPHTLRVEVTTGGELAAAAPGWLTDGEGHAYLEPSVALAGLGVEGARHVVLGAPWGFFGDVLGDDPDAIAELVAAARDHGGAEGAAGVFAMYVDDAAIDRLAPHVDRPALLDFDAVIDVPESFEAYLQRLPRHRRGSIRSELRSFTAAGLRTDVEGPECIAELVPIVAASEARHGHAISAEVLTAALLRQRELFGDAQRFFTARDRDGRLVAGAVAFVTDDEMQMRVCGVDRTLGGDAFEYFHVCYYAPVEWAARTGRARVRLGMAALEAKVLRGARLEARWAAEIAGTGGWSARVDAWNATRLDALDRLRARFPDAMDDAARRALSRRARQLSAGPEGLAIGPVATVTVRTASLASPPA